MFFITGYEHIKNKDGQIFTKVYIAQTISDEKGSKPFPLNYLVSGEIKTFIPGSECMPVLDTKQDGQLYISSLTIPTPEVEEGQVIL